MVVSSVSGGRREYERSALAIHIPETLPSDLRQTLRRASEALIAKEVSVRSISSEQKAILNKHKMDTTTGEAPSQRGENSLPSNERMFAVAIRIQEQARKLLNQKKQLLQTKAELGRIGELEEQEISANQSRRRTLLECTNERNEVELELFEVREKVQKRINSTKKVKEELEISRESRLRIQTKFNEEVENLYSPHIVETELYEKLLRAAVESKSKKAQQRRQFLKEIDSEIRSLRQGKIDLLNQRQRLLKSCKELEIEEQNGAREVSDLAAKVREILSQRRVIRMKLREAKSQCRNASREEFPQNH